MKTVIFVFIIVLVFGHCTPSQTGAIAISDTIAQQRQQTTLPSSSDQKQIDTSNYPELRDRVRLLANKIQHSSLQEAKTTKQIPKYIFNYMDSLYGKFTIANPNDEWQKGCVVDKPLPARQLIYFGKNDSIAVMSYRTGGWGVCGHLAVFEIQNSAITSSWVQYAPDTLDSQNDIVGFLKTPQDGNMLISSRLTTH